MKLLAVDGNNLLMRALHATKRAGLTAHGVPTGPLLAFVNGLAKHIREEDPTHIGVAWDAGGRGMRNETDGEYKANRLPAPDDEHELKESSFALAKRFCTLAGIHQCEYPGAGVEADDIIGAWWRAWVGDRVDDRMVILSSDKDLLQLVDRAMVEQVRLSSANTETDRWNYVRVREFYGVPAASVPALLAIAGDSSDNIKGVWRIGLKKAAKALQDHDLDFEGCIRQRWPDEVERLRKNLQLTDLRRPWPYAYAVPAPPCPPEVRLTGTGDPRFDDRYEPLIEFLDRYELDSVKTKLVARQLWGRRPPERQLGRPLKLPVT